MRSKKDPDRSRQAKGNFSRRGFIRGVGIGSGALGTGLLEKTAEAAPAVLMNGKSVYSCSVLAIDAQGKAIETIEGIAEPGKLHPVSAAFWNNDAQQCGYCTPGFVMAAKGFLAEHPNPNLEEVEHGLGGNLCRCGTYMGVRQAVLEAARNLKPQGGKNG